MGKALCEVIGGKAEGWLCLINWGEICHTTMREQGETVAEYPQVFNPWAR